MAVFDIALPDHGASKETKTRVNSLKFGDGYEQRVGDGLNTIVESWSLSFTLRTKAIISEIDDFLELHNGVMSFTWTTPKGQTKRFKCSSWTPVYNHDTNCSLTCIFEQVYEP